MEERVTRRRFLTMQALVAGADVFTATEAVATTALEHPEWDMDEVRDLRDWFGGDDHAVPERQAAPLPVGQAPRHRPAVDQEVRVEDPAQAEEEPPEEALGPWRRREPPEVMVAMFPNVRCWRRRVADGYLTVLRTVEPTDDRSGWAMHVSISHKDGRGRPGRYPTWDEQKEAVWRFAPGRRMASYLPAEGDPYVNLHETTFHWWEVSQQEIEQVVKHQSH